MPHAPDLQFERTVRNAPGVIRAAQLETDTVAALFVHGERLVGLQSKRARLCELDPRARSGRALPLEVDREVRDCPQVRGESKADGIAAVPAADEADRWAARRAVHDLAVAADASGRRRVDHVTSAPAAEAVHTRAARELVVAGPAEKPVVSGTAVQPVVPGAAVEGVVAAKSLENVRSAAAAQDIAPFGSFDDSGRSSGRIRLRPRCARQREHCGRKRERGTGQPPVGARADHPAGA